jgi:sec-independent protein translocase protein TatA
MGGASIWHWIVVGLIVMLLFGRGKISEMMGDVAKGIKAFKKGMADDDTAPVASGPVANGPVAQPGSRDAVAGDQRAQGRLIAKRRVEAALYFGDRKVQAAPCWT